MHLYPIILGGIQNHPFLIFAVKESQDFPVGPSCLHIRSSPYLGLASRTPAKSGGATSKRLSCRTLVKD